MMETCPPKYCKSFCTPLLDIANSITSPTYLFGHRIVERIIGSLISCISFTVGNSAGELIVDSSPLVLSISYATLGAVVIRSRSYSLSSLSFTTSKCNVPKKPHLKPLPKISEFSGSKVSEESFRFSFCKASLKAW